MYAGRPALARAWLISASTLAAALLTPVPVAGTDADGAAAGDAGAGAGVLLPAGRGDTDFPGGDGAGLRAAGVAVRPAGLVAVRPEAAAARAAVTAGADPGPAR